MAKKSSDKDKTKRIAQIRADKEKSRLEREQKKRDVSVKDMEFHEKVAILKEPKFEVVISTGETVSLKQAKHWYKKKTAHLPKKEQRILDIHYSKYRSYLGKIGGKHSHKGGKQRLILQKYEAEVVELFGKMFQPEEVQLALEDMHSVKIPLAMLNKLRRSQIETITEKIEKHKNSHSELRLAHKKSRLEELTELYYKLKKQFLQNPHAAINNSLLATLRAVKDEVEGDLVISGAMNINLEHQISAHFKTEVYKSANIQELIVAKVATRMGINPLQLMWSIENSYYHDLNQTDLEDVDFEEVTFPSEENYDYNKIEAEYEKRKEERKKATEIINKNTEVTPEMAQKYKQKLLDKISGTKKKVKSKKDIMAAIRKVKDQKYGIE